MPALSSPETTDVIKLMYIGDSGTGKTGSLTSLVNAGYKLRILDMDRGVSVLHQFVMKECPDKVDNVSYVTCADKYRADKMRGPTIKGVARAYIDALKFMEEWEDGTHPEEWGPDTIFIIDSLTGLGQAAIEWARSINPSVKDGRQWYNEAQRSLETVLSMLTDKNFHCNVIVISHVQYTEDSVSGAVRGHATAIGKALGPYIPRYFNTMILAEMSGTGKSVKRTIRTVPTNLIALKNPAPFKVDEALPLETGLATLFEKLKEI